MNLILASASPRRKELLGLFRIPFEIRVADIDETMDPEKAPFDEVARVSSLKAAALQAASDDVVVAADTIVVCEGKVLGKPHSAADAASMLQLLSGRDHQVMTGVTVKRGEAARTFTEVTDIHFRNCLKKKFVPMLPPASPWTKLAATAFRAERPCSAPAWRAIITM